MLSFIIWIIAISIFIQSGLGFLCLYVGLRVLASPYFWLACYFLYLWANKK